MAVQLFKDGGSTFVEPDHLQNMLNAGWSLVDPDAPLPPGVVIINQKPEGQPHVVIPEKKRGRPRKNA